MKALLLLLLAIACELVGTTALKLSDGMTKWVPTLFVFTGYGPAPAQDQGPPWPGGSD